VAAPTGSVGWAGVVAASEMATGVVVGSAVILAPASAHGHYVPATARRPTSVIVSRVTSIGRLPAYMIPGAAVESPSRTRLAARP
jgi:hypothetical protein